MTNQAAAALAIRDYDRTIRSLAATADHDPHQTCSVCRQSKPLDYFYSGHHICKRCSNARAKRSRRCRGPFMQG
jgi:hypothetical protein